MSRIFKWIISCILIPYFGVVLYIYFNLNSIIFSPSPDYHPPPKSFNISQKFINFIKFLYLKVQNNSIQSGNSAVKVGRSTVLILFSLGFVLICNYFLL